jgi:hypothetical protein
MTTTEISMFQDDTNKAEMAAALGFGNDAGEKQVGFPRLQVNQMAIKEKIEVKGKLVDAEVVKSGAFRLTVDDMSIYADTIKFRPFVQQFMIKRYDEDKQRKGKDGKAYKGEWYHTVMSADPWAPELLDDQGGINCGKPAGYIKDFASLPKDQQEFIKKCKRYRVLLGTVELVNPVDSTGKAIENAGATPCIYEVGGASFKPFDAPFKAIKEADALPLETHLLVTNDVQVNGSVEYYPALVTTELDVRYKITDEDKVLIGDFVKFVEGWNKRIMERNLEKSHAVQKVTVDPDDEKVAAEFIDMSSDLG